MRLLSVKAGAALAALALAYPLYAGGFWVQLGNPEATNEAKKMNAVLTLRPMGCHEPEKAKITATAIGVVDGRRQSVPLKVTALPQPALYAVTRQWPQEGKWVIEIIAEKDGHATSALAPAGPGGVDRHSAKLAPRPPTAEEVSALLAGAAEMRASK